MSTLRYREIENLFADIKRVYISGSSESGKTYFAERLLQSGFINCNRVYFFHPDVHEKTPVNWHEKLDIPIIYQAGLPSENDLCDIPKHSCIIIDDLFAEACKVKHVDYLFRVLSSKHKLNVIIMTQRYFAEGDTGRSIRNSSNYHVLMRNADERTNSKVGVFMNLKEDFATAIKLNERKPYPYIFIDRTQYGRLSNIYVYIDLFSRYKAIIYNSMPHYLVSETDFKTHFCRIDKNLAKPYENKTKLKISDTGNNEDNDEQSSEESSEEEICDDSKKLSAGVRQRYEKRRKFERKVRNIIQRDKERAELRVKNF